MQQARHLGRAHELMLASVLVWAGLMAGCTGEPVASSDTDPASRWPTHPDKDALGDPDTSMTAPFVGEPFPRLRTQDQFGDEVDFYDFSGSDVPVVVQLVYLDDELSVDLAELLAGQGGNLDPTPLGGLPAAVEASELFYVRIISVRPTSQGGAARASDVADWHRRFPQDRSPLLLDDEGLVYNYLQRYWVSGVQPVRRPEIVQVAPSTMTIARPAADHLDILEDLLGHEDT